MKKIVLFIPFLLSGCFMYDNFKCSLEGNCQEYQSEESFEASADEKAEWERKNKILQKQIEAEEKEEKEYTQKAKFLISQRCVLFGWKKGTAKYALCNKARFGSYETSVYMTYNNSYKKAYEAMVERYKNDEKNCIEYGVKRGTPEFNECRIQFEQQYIENLRISIEGESKSETPIYQPTFSSPSHCSSHRIGDSVYTDCY